jgi:hypothetical protein
MPLDYVNAYDMPGMVRDPVLDQTGPFQAALNAAAAAGQRLVWNGDIVTQSGITIPKLVDAAGVDKPRNIRLTGDGALRSRLLCCSASGSHVKSLGKGVTIEGIGFGIAEGVTRTGGYALEVNGTGYFRMSDWRVEGGYSGICINAIANIHIGDGEVFNLKPGVGVGIDVLQGLAFTLENVNGGHDPTAKPLANLRVFHAGDVNLKNNRFLFAKHGAIICPGPNQTVNFFNAVQGDFDGNDEHAVLVNPTGGGIVQFFKYTHAEANGGKECLHFEPTNGGKISEVRIEGMTMIGHSVACITAIAETGTIENFNVTGCDIGQAPVGIRLKGVKRGSINGNLIGSSGNWPGCGVGIVVEDGLDANGSPVSTDDMVIDDNNLKGNSTPLVFASTGKGNRIGRDNLGLDPAATVNLGGNVSDWSPAGLHGSDYLRINCTALATITGIDAPTYQKSLRVLNCGSAQITLAHEHGWSAAQNRFYLGCNIVLQPNEGCTLIYDMIDQRWRRV